jgi:UDP-galactose transporter B1
MLGLSVLATTGQLSIYYIVKNFQPYLTAMITTVRKIITVMISIVLFNHHLQPLQWLSVAVVFFGVILEMMDEMKENAKKQKNEPVK